MEFLVKQWDRVWDKTNSSDYKDVYRNLGRWDVTFSNMVGNAGIYMTLKKGGEVRNLHGGFRLQLEFDFIEYCGFERQGPSWGDLKHIQLRLYK